MPNAMVEDDPLSRTTMRRFLLLQIAALGIVLGLRLVDLFLPALVLSSLTLLLFLAVLRWLYLRYRSFPIVREARAVRHLVYKFQERLRIEGQTIQAAITERNRLFQAEKREAHTVLFGLQTIHLEEGLAAASLRAASISGIEPGLKDRLIAQGIRSAADVTDRLPGLPGLGETERQALREWRDSVLDGLESTKPQSISRQLVEDIQGTYQALHDRNNLVERKAIASVQVLEHELLYFRPRLHLLKRVTFMHYLSRSLASRGFVAAVLALLLLGTQIVSSVSGTAP